MEKPVIILGGGFAGTLLALKLKELHPHLSFTLYEESSSLGGSANCVFREGDGGPLFNLLRPMITHKWASVQFKSMLMDRWILSPLFLVKPETLHAYASEKLAPNVKFKNDISLEIALKESSFVIDTRDSSYFKKAGYVHELSLELDLETNHNLLAPVLFEAESVDISEYFSYFPINEQKIIIHHNCYTKKALPKRADQFNSILQFINLKGYKINKVIEEKSSSTTLPTQKPYVHQENRVISLAAFMNPTTGCQLSILSEIIDKMVRTSFRYGELKSLMTSESKNFENRIKFYHYLNRQILTEKILILETVFNQSSSAVERFYQHKLTFLDRSRIIYGYSQRRFYEMTKLLNPLKIYSLIQGQRALLYRN